MPLQPPIPDSAVMGQIQKQRGTSPKMDLEQILQQDAEKNHPGLDVQKTLNVIDNEMKRGRMVGVRAGNTIFVVSTPPPVSKNTMMFSAARPDEITNEIKQALESFYSAGYDNIEATLTNPKMLKIIQGAGANVKTTPSKSFSGGKPSMEISVAVGKPNV